jgi:uncharacterized membrane protein YgcG
MDELTAYADRLERAAETLRTRALDPDEAARLVDQAATLATEAAQALERHARAAAHEPLPGQDSLL